MQKGNRGIIAQGTCLYSWAVHVLHPDRISCMARWDIEVCCVFEITAGCKSVP